MKRPFSDNSLQSIAKILLEFASYRTDDGKSFIGNTRGKNSKGESEAASKKLRGLD